ncbi:hypothetical protein [Pseudomonas syringae]|nr:hypothetical protein [Pseudomonas syringae]
MSAFWRSPHKTCKAGKNPRLRQARINGQGVADDGVKKQISGNNL